MYQIPNKDDWQGRIDGSAPEVLRWHQVVDMLDISQEINATDVDNTVAFLGFCCDEGVRRNKGRVGAFYAPQALRKVIANFPARQLGVDIPLFDAGNCICLDENLEKSQEELAEKVAQLLRANYRPMLLGGGHEIAYGHFQGIKKAFPNSRIGVINFDAHFDIRPPEPTVGATSGTGFWQIANEESNFNYLALGIQQNSNTQYLFDIADKFGAKYVLGSSFNYDDRNQVIAKISDFIENVDVIYLTICLDVFAAPFAPAVSALAYSGIFPDKIFQDFFDYILRSPKLKSMDIAELNPSLDIDNRTARLAAGLIFKYVGRNLC